MVKVRTEQRFSLFLSHEMKIERKSTVRLTFVPSSLDNCSVLHCLGNNREHIKTEHFKVHLITKSALRWVGREKWLSGRVGVVVVTAVKSECTLSHRHSTESLPELY